MTNESTPTAVEGLPAWLAGYYYAADPKPTRGQETTWRQCRICSAYIEWPIGQSERAVAHVGHCPVAAMESLLPEVTALRAQVTRLTDEVDENKRAVLTVMRYRGEDAASWLDTKQHLEAENAALKADNVMFLTARQEDLFALNAERAQLAAKTAECEVLTKDLDHARGCAPDPYLLRQLKAAKARVQALEQGIRDDVD